MKKKSLTALGMLTVALIVVIALLPIVAANPPKNPNRTVIRIEYTEHSMTIFYSDGWARTYLYGEDGSVYMAYWWYAGLPSIFE